MEIPYQITILDKILKEYYAARDEAGDALFEPLFIQLTQAIAEDKVWYLNKLKEDRYLLVTPHTQRTEVYMEEVTTHSAHITKSGEEFYRQGGYEEQHLGELRKQEAEAAFKEREILAAELGTKAAQESAKSSQSAAWAAWIALALTLALAGTQYGCSEQKEDKIKMLQNRLDSLVKQLNTSQLQVKAHKDSLSKQKK